MRQRMRVGFLVIGCLIGGTGLGYAAASPRTFWLQPASIPRITWFATEMNAAQRKDCPDYLVNGQHCVSFLFAADEKNQKMLILVAPYGDVPLDSYEKVVDTAKQVLAITAKGEFGRDIPTEVRRLDRR